MPGPYGFKNPELIPTLKGKPAVIPASDKAYGVQCVGLIKTYSDAGITSSWKEGVNVMANPPTQPTAIATFIDGAYPSHAHGNHACFFLRKTDDGIVVLEQHVKPHPGLIQEREIKSRKGKSPSISDDADAYSVIM